ncbi:MAG: zinc ABC transporter substrate-binding protein [Candidatus Rhabdochlamydia sp.]
MIMFLIGCEKPSSKLSEWKADSAHVKVLCTNAIIHDLVARVGGERIFSLSLIDPLIDPHSYEMRKGDEEKFLSAQVIFFNGLGLEHSPSLLKHLLSHPSACCLGDFITAKDPSLILEDKGQVDPHIWLDTLLWSYTIDPIVEKLSTFDPEGKEYYEQRGSETKASLLALHHLMLETFHSIPSQKKHLVSSHDAFNYFTRRYLVENSLQDWRDYFCAPEGLAPDGQLSFYDLKRVIAYIQKHHVKVVFSETNVSQDSLRKIVDICQSEAYDVKIYPSHLLSDTLGDHNSYESMMKHNLSVLVKAWSET